MELFVGYISSSSTAIRHRARKIFTTQVDDNTTKKLLIVPFHMWNTQFCMRSPYAKCKSKKGADLALFFLCVWSMSKIELKKMHAFKFFGCFMHIIFLTPLHIFSILSWLFDNKFRAKMQEIKIPIRHDGPQVCIFCLSLMHLFAMFCAIILILLRMFCYLRSLHVLLYHNGKM